MNFQSARDNNWSALHLASGNGNAEFVRILLAHPDINVNIKNDWEITPLHFAIKAARIPSLQLLLNDPRVDVNAVAKDGSTPLFMAVSSGRLDVVSWLIAKRGDQLDLTAEVSVEGEMMDVFELAEKGNHKEVLELLTRFKEDPVAVRESLGTVEDECEESPF